MKYAAPSSPVLLVAGLLALACASGGCQTDTGKAPARSDGNGIDGTTVSGDTGAPMDDADSGRSAETGGPGGETGGTGQDGATPGGDTDHGDTGEAPAEDGATPGGDTGDGETGETAVATGDDFVSGVNITVHPQTATILVATWTQARAADATFLEFSFSGSTVMTSRPVDGSTGVHRDVVLGVPEKTLVTVRIVSRLGGADYRSVDYQGTTGAIPSGMPRPTFVAYDASLASPDRWMFGAVEDSPGGCADISCYYISVFWIYIMDRQGRIVWYWADPAGNSSHAYPRVARDGEYIVIDRGRGGPTGVLKMTLDRRYYEEVSIPDVDDAIDVTTDGSVLYDVVGELREMSRQGTIRSIWHYPYDCYCNAVTWVPQDDTVLLSFPGPSTVVQIDRKTGALVGQYGSDPGSYAFSPADWQLQFPHAPTITPQGTLLVSTHLPGFPYDSTTPGPYQHAFEEFDIDRANQKLTLKWAYRAGPEWPLGKGMALRLANGNTLVNYGTGGVIREVTPDQQTAFEVKFDVATGDDFFNKMVGNNVFVDDLYALNGGGPR
jgi:hypothetical protein